MKKISILIPCYNSERTIEHVVNEIVETLSKFKSYDYEIILVNDDSPDNVYDIIKKLVNNNSKIKGISLTKNFGQHAALMAAFHNLSGNIAVAVDDDGQTPIDNYLIELIRSIESGNDVVFARYFKVKQSLFRRVGSKINDIMLRMLLSKPKHVVVNSYFACNQIMIDEIKKYKGPFPYIAGILLRSTKKIININVEHRSRLYGKSNYNIFKLILLWLNGFTAFSIIPLRIATVTGFVTMLIGFICILLVVIRKLFISPDIPVGYSSIISLTLFIGGIVILITGMIGEYVGRIYLSMNNTPQYIIREKIN